MSNLDSRLFERYQDSILTNKLNKNSKAHQEANHEDSDPDSDDLLQELEDELEKDDDDAFTKRYREARLEELSKQMSKSKKLVNSLDSDTTFQEFEKEGELIKLTTANSKMVILFFNKTFNTCAIINQALEKLSMKHLNTKFVKIDPVNAPFLTTRLNIQTLPCVLSYKNGVEIGRFVGLEGMIKGTDINTFQVENLEKLLITQGMLDRKAYDLKRSIRTKTDYNNDSDESDLDI